MAVYVDPLIHYSSRRAYCHLMADADIAELHAFAQRIKLKRAWFQNHKFHPHYDLNAKMRRKAILHGAIQISSIEMLRRCGLPTFARRCRD